MFLFILFFQPVELEGVNFNNNLLVIAGFGTITFLALILFRIVLLMIIPKFFDKEDWKLKHEVISNTSIWIVNSVAYAFYDHYVGLVPITMYLMFKIVLLSIAPVLTIVIIYRHRYLSQQIDYFSERDNKLNKISAEMEDDTIIEFDSISERKLEKISLTLGNIIFLRSADNYVDIVYKEDEETHRILIRNTLKNIEEKLKIFPAIVRCHRSYIVNRKYIIDLINNQHGFRLKLIDYEEEIPVSRQYLLFVREVLKKS